MTASAEIPDSKHRIFRKGLDGKLTFVGNVLREEATVSGLVQGIARMTANPEQRRRMGEDAREISMRNFLWDGGRRISGKFVRGRPRHLFRSLPPF